MVDGELLVKDLIKTGKDLSKVLIIDNIPENFRRQPDNGIFINTWTGQEKDAGLLELLPFLKELAKGESNDVREFLKNCKKRLIEKIDKGSLTPSVFFS